MTSREMQSAFEYEINKFDVADITSSDIIFYWLNTSIQQFVEARYSNPTESFEETQKVTDELKYLVKEVTITPTGAGNWPNGYFFNLPADYAHALNEEVTIEYPHPNNGAVDVNKRVGITEVSSTTISSQIGDPYSTFKLHYEQAKPLRLFMTDQVELITDGNYTVEEYFLRYLKIPVEIDLTVQPTELPVNVHRIIIQAAAMLYLRSLGISEQQQPQKTQ